MNHPPTRSAPFPYTTLFRSPAPAATTAEAMEDVTEALRLRRHLRPGQDNNFAVVSQEKFLEKLNSRSEEHTSELQSHSDLVCRLLLEKKNKTTTSSDALLHT